MKKLLGNIFSNIFKAGHSSNKLIKFKDCNGVYSDAMGSFIFLY